MNKNILFILIAHLLLCSTQIEAQQLIQVSSLEVDPNDQNTGSFSNGVDCLNPATYPKGIIFGPCYSGEGITSTRGSGTTNKFGIDFWTNYSSKLSITNQGNVGIGTRTPTQKLEVNGNIKINPNSFLTAASNDNFSYNGLTVAHHGLGWYQTSPAISARAYLSGYGGVSLFTQGQARMTVTEQGNVGIGTAAPGAKLHVNGPTWITSPSGWNSHFYWGANEDTYIRGGKATSNVIIGDYGNNVGIGTQTPQQKLSVVGGVNVDAGNTFNGVINAGMNNALKFGTSITGEAIGSNRTGGSNVNGLDFYTGYISRMSIANSGNVGIGTSNPLHPLSFANTLGGKICLWQENTGFYGFSVQPSELQIHAGSNGPGAGGADITLGSAYDNVYYKAMTIKGNGNVGIGTQTPSNRLEIKSNSVGTSGLKFTNLTSNSTATAANGKALSVDASGNVVLIPDSGVSYTATTGIYISGTTIGAQYTSAIWNANRLQGRTVSPTSPTTGQVLAYNGTSWTPTTISSGGSSFFASSSTGVGNIVNTNTGGVIIGSNITSTPAGYKLYVSDGILTEKVKAALKTGSQWADHVFEDDYQLKSLAEVETFVKQNKHLPNVPSAEELVKGGGIDMVKMFAKQMEKIEELTLYIIEQNKRLEQLERENASRKN